MCFLLSDVYAESRLKDIVYFEGIRDNMLVGYGLIVGLNGTGDNLQNSEFTEKGLVDFLAKLGINTKGANLKTKNIAAVMVTATLPAFSRSGSRIPVNISTLGDAKNLKGGTLLATPLMGADGNVYAVAQGQVSIGALSETNRRDDNTKPIPTSGYIMNGAIVEKEINFDLNSLSTLKIALKNSDISTARAIANAINSMLHSEKAAHAEDPGTVSVQIPERYENNVLGLLADIENIHITPDTIAKIVIDEATGTIVIGENVKISRVAIAQGNLVVKVTPEKEFEYKAGLIADDPKEEESEPGTKLATLNATANLSDLVKGLNTLGVKPQDLIAILKSIQQAGALQAIIEVR